MKKQTLPDALVVLSLLAVVLAVLGSLGYDLWLASTQWILVAITLAAYGIYLKMR